MEMQKETEKKYTKSQRVVAWIGIILLAILYLATLISAILATPVTYTLFRMCLIATVLLPLTIFGYIKIYSLFTGR